MNVLHVTPYMHPSAGGPPIVVEKFAVFGALRGWCPSVITTGSYCGGDETELVQKLGRLFPIKIINVGIFNFNGLNTEASDVMEESVRKSDLVHIHTLWHPLTGLARKYCRIYNKPYIMMPHGMLDPYSLGIKKAKKQLYMLMCEKRNLQGAERLIYTTPEEESLARISFSWLPPGMIVPLGSDNPPLKDRKVLAEAFFQQFPHARGKRCLLFLSRLHLKKGLDRVLDAFERIAKVYSDTLLIVAGNGEPRYVETIRKQVHSKRLTDSVLFTGLLQGELKWGAFAASEQFLLPSRQENFALVVAEAMHMGVPVILTNKVNSWPYVDKAQAGIVLDETDILDRLVKAISLLLDSPVLGREMGQRGQSLARQELTWNNSATVMVDCYNEIVRAWKH